MLFGEGPQIKNIAADLNKLFRQGSLLNQSGQTIEGDSTADQGTSDLLAARDPVIQEISVGMSGEQSARYTVSGTPPLSLPNSLGKPLKAWAVEVSPYQEGTGDPAPDNVRPIHGTDKINIVTSGKNLAALEQGTINVSDGTEQPSTTRVRTNFIPVIYNTVYAASSEDNGWKVRNGVLYDKDYHYISYGVYPGGYNDTVTIADPSACYIRLIYSHSNTSEACTPSDYWYQFEAGSTATPYTPYIAPSQTVIDVPPLSANKWDEEWEVGAISLSTGQNVPNSNRIRSVNFIPCEPNTSYYVLGRFTNGLVFYDSTKTYLGMSTSLYPQNTVITTPNNAYYMRFSCSDSYGTTYNHDIAINYPSTVTTYNPYSATVYTGTIGSEGGESRSAMVDMGAQDWIYHSGFDVFYYLTPDGKPTGTGQGGYGMCEAYDVIEGTYYSNLADGQMAVGTNFFSITTATVVVKDRRFTDALQFKAAVAGIKLVYEIADSVHFPLTTPPIPTPKGNATTWATAEDGTVESMEVTYVGEA